MLFVISSKKKDYTIKQKKFSEAMIANKDRAMVKPLDMQYVYTIDKDYKQERW